MKNIGFDLGGTDLKYGLIDESGNVLYSKKSSVVESKEFNKVLDIIENSFYDIIENNNLSINDIKKIGIGQPGTCDESGKVLFAPNLNWRNKPLKSELEKRLNLDVIVGNDVNTAALGELNFGALKGSENCVLLTLGTGLGGALIINNKIYNGSNNISGEIGHMIVGENFYNCNCGNNGCLETFASATGLIKYFKENLESDKSLELKNNNINGEIIFKLAKENELALKSINRLINYLSIGIANLFNILDIEKIVLGGGLSEGLNDYIQILEERASSYTFDKRDLKGRIKIGELKNNAGIIGASILK